MAERRDESTDDRLFSQASRWFFRLQADDVTGEERGAFETWLAADEAHRGAWAEVRELSFALKHPALAVQERRGASQGGRGRGLRTVTATIGGLILAGAVGLAMIQGPVLLDRWRADYVTREGEHQTVVLSDGTHVELDSDTALAAKLTGSERRLTLLRGAAYFSVAHEGRPFVVTSGAGESRDIGTTFTISRDGMLSTVTVETGLVDVALSGSGQVERLAAGQSLDYAGTWLSAVRPVDVADDLAWRHGQVVFRQQRLAVVVARLNRYRKARLVLVNPWIADERVSGTFNVAQPGSVVSALETVLGIRATRLGPWLVLLR